MRSNIANIDRLTHILDAIKKIEIASADVDEDKFLTDFIIHTAVIKWIEIIGEASYKLTKEFKDGHNDVPWKLIEGLRHILVHDYFEVNLETIWHIVQQNIPVLKPQMEQLYNELKTNKETRI